MPDVTILSFGHPRILVYDTPVVLDRRKALGLAVYLAAAAAPRGRDELASLLWPELSQERARAALRSTLPDLVTRGPTGWIRSEHGLLALSPETVWSDVATFESLLREARTHDHGEGPLCEHCLAALSKAAALYRGDFLEGFSLAGCPDFEAWELSRREALRRDLAWTLRHIAAHHHAVGEEGREAALAYGQRWLDLDPLHEPAHRLLMELYAAAGMAGEVVRQYRSCANLLATELGVTPAPETVALFERLAAGATHERGLSGLPAAPRPYTPEPTSSLRRAPLRLPAEPGPLIGRQVELAALAALLADSDCRLVTLTGPGGIGKTRLALRAAATLARRFADGACLVQLSDATAPSQMVSLIASALGVPLIGSDEPAAAVMAALRDSNMLLVLDNFEQLLDAAGLLLELLGAAPGLKLLVTSRERLALRAETVLPLDGLAFPAEGEAPDAGHSAVELFVERARQVRPGFALSAANSAEIARICALVDGLPLGIELAAAWARSLTPAEIAAEIARSPDFLRASLRDLPERHRSLRAVFTHSWLLLSSDEQRSFRRLALFRGGLTAEAAEVVAGASLHDLAALADTSLLRRNPDGRYSLHPLLQQYAAERLAEQPTEEQELRERHAAYYAALVARHEPALRGAEQPAALAALARDGGNIHAAWTWAVTYDLAVVELMFDGLARFSELRGYQQEAESALAALIPRLEHEPAHSGLLARAQAWRGRFLQMLGRADEAEDQLAQAVALSSAQGDRATLAFCLVSRGVNANTRGEHPQAMELHRASLELYSTIGDSSGMADVLNRLGGNAYDLGDLTEARDCWERSVAIYRKIGDASGLGRGLSNLGELQRLLGNFAESRRLSEQALEILAEVGRSWQSLYALLNLGLLSLYAGHPDEARSLNMRCLVQARRIADARGEASAILREGDRALTIGAMTEARARYLESLTRFRAIGRLQGIGASLAGLAEVAVRQGEGAAAVGLAGEALALARGSGGRMGEGLALLALGSALAVAGESGAADTLAEALALFQRLGARPDALEARARLAELLLREGAGSQGAERAVNLLAGLADDPACRATTRARAVATAVLAGLTPAAPTGGM